MEVSYFQWMHHVFDDKPVVPFRWYSYTMSNMPVLSHKEQVLSDNELMHVEDWIEQQDKIRISEIESTIPFTLDDHSVFKNIFDKAISVFGLNKQEIQTEPYMKHFIHCIDLHSPMIQCPFVHDVNLRSNTVSARIYICIKKGSCAYSGMLYTDQTLYNVEPGCMTMIYPSETWYTFMNGTEKEDGYVYWCTFGISIPLSNYLENIKAPDYVESVKTRLSNYQSGLTTNMYTEKSFLTHIEYQTILPNKAWSDAYVLATRLPDPLTHIHEDLLDYIIRNSRQIPAIIYQYNTIICQLPYDQLDIDVFIKMHYSFSQTFSTYMHVTNSNSSTSLMDILFMHISKGGFYFEESIDCDHMVLIILKNMDNRSKLYQQGSFYELKEGHSYYISKRYGITMNACDQPFVALKLRYQISDSV